MVVVVGGWEREGTYDVVVLCIACSLLLVCVDVQRPLYLYDKTVLCFPLRLLLFVSSS